jgi:maleate isomerase
MGKAHEIVSSNDLPAMFGELSMAVAGRADQGFRARIGIVVPSVNTVMEPWAQRSVPQDVSVHFSRMFLPDQMSTEALIEMDRSEGMSGIRQLTSARPHVIAYGCTASSIVQGIDYDRHLREEIQGKFNVPSTTAAYAILQAASTLGARKVSLVSPYTAEVASAEHDFFESAGLKVLGGAHLGISDGFRLAEPDADDLFRLGLDGWNDASDALLISCLNTRSHAVIAALEQSIGKPVITSTQATLWHALRLAGVNDRIEGFGKLLSQH